MGRAITAKKHQAPFAVGERVEATITIRGVTVTTPMVVTKLRPGIALEFTDTSARDELLRATGVRTA